MPIKERIVSIGSVVGAVLASACCLGPLILGAVGAGSLGVAAALAPYRPWFLALTAVLLGVAGRRACCGATSASAASSRCSLTALTAAASTAAAAASTLARCGLLTLSACIRGSRLLTRSRCSSLTLTLTAAPAASAAKAGATSAATTIGAAAAAGDAFSSKLFLVGFAGGSRSLAPLLFVQCGVHADAVRHVRTRHTGAAGPRAEIGFAFRQCGNRFGMMLLDRPH